MQASPSSSSSVAARASAAILGACIADAAAQPLHWIYDNAKLREALEGCIDAPEFRPESANPFYRLETGSGTCYQDQSYVLLQSIIQSKGFSQENFQTNTFNYFKDWIPPSKDNLPIQGPWLQGSLRGFLNNVKENKTYPDVGADDSQLDCCAKIAPLVAFYAGKEELLDRAEEAIRTTQNTEAAIGFGLAGVRILEAIILGSTVIEAINKCLTTLRDRNRAHPNEIDNVVAQKLRQAVERKGKPHSDVVAEFGKS